MTTLETARDVAYTIEDCHRVQRGQERFALVVHNSAVIAEDATLSRVLDVLQERCANALDGAGVSAADREKRGFGEVGTGAVRWGKAAEAPTVQWGEVERALAGELASGELAPAELDAAFEDLRQFEVLLAPGEKKSHVPQAEEFQPRLTNLVLQIVQDCNLRCSYCYADTGAYGSPRMVMDVDVAKQYVDMLMEQSGSSRGVSITFFGGEPMMRFDIVEEVVPYAVAAAEKHGKLISFSITTNGTYLTPERAKFLLDHAFTVTVSMDGPPEVHNAVRKTTTGTGSYDDIISKLQPLLHPEDGTPSKGNVGTRVTVTRKCLDTRLIVEHLIGVGFRDVGVTPVSSTVAALQLKPHEAKQVMEGMVSLLDTYVEHALRGEVYPFSNASNVLKQIHQGLSKGFPCGAGVQLFSGDARGEVYSCHRAVGQESFHVGNLADGIDSQKREDFIESVHVTAKAECHSCWARHLCSGGCHYNGLIHRGEPGLPHLGICDDLREWYGAALAAYGSIATNNPEFLDRLVSGETCVGD